MIANATADPVRRWHPAPLPITPVSRRACVCVCIQCAAFIGYFVDRDYPYLLVALRASASVQHMVLASWTLYSAWGGHKLRQLLNLLLVRGFFAFSWHVFRCLVLSYIVFYICVLPTLHRPSRIRRVACYAKVCPCFCTLHISNSRSIWCVTLQFFNQSRMILSEALVCHCSQLS